MNFTIKFEEVMNCNYVTLSTFQRAVIVYNYDRFVTMFSVFVTCHLIGIKFGRKKILNPFCTDLNHWAHKASSMEMWVTISFNTVKRIL